MEKNEDVAVGSVAAVSPSAGNGTRGFEYAVAQGSGNSGLTEVLAAAYKSLEDDRLFGATGRDNGLSGDEKARKLIREYCNWAPSH